ncbi:RecA-family ATPase [Rhizobium sp. BK226]|uniref:AAA family ATPase n=1 Tax=Rhizobium sp. BK226 TaxID=2587075 RepID=UPI00160CA795|nr:AAA family ATPase [Rhizobium sp. BK226]MBB4113462.1 RecA-family ATPase [Rhizobium sp. BK226]
MTMTSPQLDTNIDELRAMSPRETPASDSREAMIFGIYDRLYDHGHCSVDVVLAPANATGEPDWENTGPANVSSLPADEWPKYEQAEKRACVIVSNIDGCDPDSTFIVTLHDETGIPGMFQIHGPEIDRVVADSIIGRDLGNRPPPREPTEIQKSMAKLTADLFAPPAAAVPVAANDNKPAPQQVPAAKPAVYSLPVICPAEWHGKPVPAREWYATDLIPNRQVTIVSGDGGVGKSLLTLQVAAAGALGVETMGMRPSTGRVVYLGAEDEGDEFHRRLDDIVTAHGKELRDLSDFRLLPMADLDALLARPDMRMNMQPTPLYAKLVDLICDVRPKLVVLDTAADLFGGDEIKRNQVRQFIGLLRQLAIGLDCAVVLLTHPSVAGMQSGTGSSGSTAWNNSVRSRLYLTRPEGKDADPDLRFLTTKKANYGTVGGEMKLRWKAGVFVLDDGKPHMGSQLLAAKAEGVFRKLLSLFNRTGQTVSDVTGTNYAPAKMADHPEADGISKKLLAAAMQRLLDAGEVKIVMEGPASRKRKRLILASEDYGPE